MSDIITLIRGDDYSIPITITNSDWTAYNLTGCTIRFTARPSSTLYDTDDTTAIISKTITSHTTPASWISLITLSNTDTDIAIWEYDYDLQITTATNKIHSSVKWKLNVVQDVTKDIL